MPIILVTDKASRCVFFDPSNERNDGLFQASTIYSGLFIPWNRCGEVVGKRIRRSPFKIGWPEALQVHRRFAVVISRSPYRT